MNTTNVIIGIAIALFLVAIAEFLGILFLARQIKSYHKGLIDAQDAKDRGEKRLENFSRFFAYKLHSMETIKALLEGLSTANWNFTSQELEIVEKFLRNQYDLLFRMKFIQLGTDMNSFFILTKMETKWLSYLDGMLATYVKKYPDFLECALKLLEIAINESKAYGNLELIQSHVESWEPYGLVESTLEPWFPAKAMDLSKADIQNIVGKLNNHVSDSCPPVNTQSEHWYACLVGEAIEVFERGMLTEEQVTELKNMFEPSFQKMLDKLYGAAASSAALAKVHAELMETYEEQYKKEEV